MVFDKFFVFLLVLISVIFTNCALYEGSSCLIQSSGTQGKCTLIDNCQSAKEAISRHEYPEICGFRGHDPIICCSDRVDVPEEKTTERIKEPDTPPTTRKPETTTSKRPETTTSRRPETAGTTQKTTTTKPVTVPVTEKVPVKKLPTGEISKQKCLEFNTASNAVGCKIQTSDLFFKNVAQNGEYPHQALLGYESPNGKVWKCSGALISERYVVTAARCANLENFGEVKYVRLGDLSLPAPNGINLQEHKVEKIIIHPEYVGPVTYNDIALIKLSQNIIFNAQIRPACLQVQHYIDKPEPSRKYVTTSWNGAQVSKLRIENADMKCSRIYEAEDELFSLLTIGVIPDLHICASPSVNDTCQNSENDLAGGPVQIPHPTAPCSYELIGITSNGVPCGTTVPIPGIYTRISYYVDWIESEVWYS